MLVDSLGDYLMTALVRMDGVVLHYVEPCPAEVWVEVERVEADEDVIQGVLSPGFRVT